jgi:two-component system, NarL family, response regulator DevR
MVPWSYVGGGVTRLPPENKYLDLLVEEPGCRARSRLFTWGFPRDYYTTMAPQAKSAHGKNPRMRQNPHKIRILVADDQPMDRRGIVALLGSQPDFEIVAEAGTVSEATSHCKRLKPDVAILSVRLPDQDGRTSIASLRASHPRLRMIALAERGATHCLVLNPPHRPGRGLPVSSPASTMCTDCLQLAVSEGALGALRRDAEPEELFQAVRAVAQGNAWFEPRTAAAISRGATGTGAPRESGALSARELEVAGLISDGRSNKEIGKALGISEPTVKKHVGHILAKLGLQDRLQIGIHMVRNPLLLARKIRRG